MHISCKVLFVHSTGMSGAGVHMCLFAQFKQLLLADIISSHAPVQGAGSVFVCVCVCICVCVCRSTLAILIKAAPRLYFLLLLCPTSFPSLQRPKAWRQKCEDLTNICAFVHVYKSAHLLHVLPSACK